MKQTNSSKQQQEQQHRKQQQQQQQQQKAHPRPHSIKFKWDKKTVRMKNPVCPAKWFWNLEKFLIQAAMSGISQSPKTSPQKMAMAGSATSRSLLPGSQGTVAAAPAAAAVMAPAAQGQAQPMKTLTLLAPSTMPAGTNLATSQVQYRLITGDNKPVSVVSSASSNSNRPNAPTVRELLHNQRKDEPASASAIVSRMATRSTPSKTTASGGKGVMIDLTEEEENSPKRDGHVQGSPRQQMTMLQSGSTLLTQAVTVQQGAAGVQGINPATLRPGQTLLLQGNPTSGTMVLQPVVTQPIRVQAAGNRPTSALLMAAAGGTGPGTVLRHTLVPSTQQIRPGLASRAAAPLLGVRPPSLGVRQPSQPKAALTQQQPSKHPAPLPPQPAQKTGPQLKAVPPKPGLKISHVQQGIVLSWNMTVTDSHATIISYQLFAYQEGSSPPTSSLWKKVGDVKALPLPMACTLTQFQEGNRYHFAVRAVDVHQRVGPFSDPNTISLVSKSSS